MKRFRPAALMTALILSSLTFGSAQLAAAQTKPELSGEAILKEAFKDGASGFQKGSALLEMTVTKASGKSRSRTMSVKALKNPKTGLLKTLVRFEAPSTISGTSFLVLQKKNDLPEQYVYIPATQVVRRIAASGANKSFFGSDFNYIDLMPMGSENQDKVSIQRLPDSEVGGQPVYVVEVSPKVMGSPYKKLITYIHQEKNTPLKMEFFDPQGALLKKLVMQKMKKLNGKLVPVEMKMSNVQKGSNTVIVIKESNPEAKLSDDMFTQEAMQL